MGSICIIVLLMGYATHSFDLYWPCYTKIFQQLMAYSPISKAHNIIECMKESNLL